MRRASIPRWPQIDPQAQHICSTTNLGLALSRKQPLIPKYTSLISVFFFLGFCTFQVLDLGFKWHDPLMSAQHNTHTQMTNISSLSIRLLCKGTKSQFPQFKSRIDGTIGLQAMNLHTHNKTKQLKHAHNSRNRSHYFCLEGNLLEQKAIEKGFRQFDLEPEHYICIYGGIRILYIYIYNL